MFRGPADMMGRDVMKPRNTGSTLARFAHYFRPYWGLLILVALIVIVATWTSVTTPDLTGEAVDCYLSPAAASAFGNFPGAQQVASTSQTNCWLAQGLETSDLTHKLFRSIATATNMPVPAADNSIALTDAQRLTGLGGVMLMILVLYVVGALMNGLMFFLMTWAGQNVLRAIRIDVFKQLHRLSLGYYGEHEAGDLMSRITNDSETIGQAFNFALVNVVSGVLLLVWITYNMLSRNVPFALISLVAAPAMIIATLWFSSQARKAFRSARKSIGNVNAELQESISAVREVQAFNRADENIENFKVSNAANRDANVKAVSYTAALNPVLEALGYLALALVTCVGGLVLLSGPDALRHHRVAGAGGHFPQLRATVQFPHPANLGAVD